jgi:hypothetical protein
MSKISIGLGEILMEIMWADDRLLFRLKARNQGIAGASFAAGHIAGRVAGSAGLIGASHG